MHEEKITEIFRFGVNLGEDLCIWKIKVQWEHTSQCLSTVILINNFFILKTFLNLDYRLSRNHCLWLLCFAWAFPGRNTWISTVYMAFTCIFSLMPLVLIKFQCGWVGHFYSMCRVLQMMWTCAECALLSCSVYVHSLFLWNIWTFPVCLQQ